MTFFFDSSALLKRYVWETGTGWVRSVADPASGNSIYIARITLVEMTAAIARQMKGKLIRHKIGSAMIAAVRHDVLIHYRTLEVEATSVSLAADLAERHALRAYDAVQLGLASVLAAERVAANLPSLTFVSSDRELNVAAAAEGLTVVDPNDHP